MELREFLEKYIRILEIRERMREESRNSYMLGVEELASKYKRGGYAYGIQQKAMDAAIQDAKLEVYEEVINDLASALEEV